MDNYIKTPILAVVANLILGCHPNPPEFSSAPQEDTRVLVKAAFDSVDRKVVTVAFNSERARMFKTMMDNETDQLAKMNLAIIYANELLKSGNAKASIDKFNEVTEFINANKLQLDSTTKRNLLSTIGIAYMRLGENENCVENHNHESCFIPIGGDGVHKLPFGSSQAIRIYESLLKEFPHDLETQYLLNLAYMTLGEYPDKVPAAYRIDPSWFTSKVKMQRFRDIAPELGLNRNGRSGGVIMDDFTNDGWLDIVMSSWGPDDQLLFYTNNGDGTFTNQTIAFGLQGHKSGLNINQTDFNNDGWLDIYIMRGAWYGTQGDIPNTLLMNTGKGSFADVTIKAGLTHNAPTQTSAWTDIDLDGWLDLVVANESIPGHERGIDVYMNQKNGTFTLQSAAYGLTLNYYFKGCVSTDVNNDRYPDLYFSSLNDGTFLFINQGSKGQKGFIRSGPASNIGVPLKSFPSWSFDYDNDGNEDLFTSAYAQEYAPSLQWMQSHLGNANPEFLPKLYHNKGNLIFEEVGIKMGLNEVAFTMGCNFGDINTDGFLDFYLATGNPLYQSLVPNKMYLNIAGRKFEDVSYSGGFANIQKGHSVSFGDLDHDGDEDIYVVIGGAYEGDAFYNCLFENPNEHDNHWLVLKLVGQSANKAAIGSRVIVSIQEDGQERKIYRTVTSGASFGANSLTLEVGLRKATLINNVTIQWPCMNCPDQVFSGMEINKAYLLTQNEPNPTLMEYKKVSFKKSMDQMEHMHNMQH